MDELGGKHRAMSAVMDRAALLQLYRQLLKNAKIFPSVKRKGIYEDIRIEWREGREVRDPEKREFNIRRAIHGLKTMQKFTLLDPRASSWTIDLSHQVAPQIKKRPAEK